MSPAGGEDIGIGGGVALVGDVGAVALVGVVGGWGGAVALVNS